MSIFLKITKDFQKSSEDVLYTKRFKYGQKVKSDIKYYATRVDKNDIITYGIVSESICYRSIYHYILNHKIRIYVLNSWLW